MGVSYGQEDGEPVRDSVQTDSVKTGFDLGKLLIDNPESIVSKYIYDPNLDRYIYSTDEESKGFTIDNQLSGKFATGVVDHNVLLGVDYQYLKGSSNYTSYGYDGGYTAPSFNAFAPNNNQIDRSKVTEAGVYIDDVKVVPYQKKEESIEKDKEYFLKDQLPVTLFDNQFSYCLFVSVSNFQ